MAEIYDLLQSQNDAEVLNGLKILKHRYIKDIGKITLLKKLRIISAVISLLRRQCFTNICLSIVADACVHGDFLDELFQNDGVELLVSILKNSTNNEFKNRACRALGNIAKCNTGYEELLKRTPVLYIVKFLSDSSNSQSHLICLRTLRILGVNTKTQNLIANSGGLLVISKCLISENENVVLTSLKTLISLSDCNELCKYVLLNYNNLVAIKQLFNRSKDCIKAQILILIKQLSYIKEKERKNNLKYTGLVQICCDIARRDISYEMREAAVLLLSNCLDISHSWDKHNPVDLQYHMLEILVEALNTKLFRVVHISILSSMTGLFSDNSFTDAFLQLKFIDTLISHLKTFINNNKCAHYVIDPEDLNSRYHSPIADVKLEEMVNFPSVGDSPMSSSALVEPDVTDVRNHNPRKLRTFESSGSSQSEPESDDCDIVNTSGIGRRPVRESKKRHKFYVPPARSDCASAYKIVNGVKKQKMSSNCQASTSSKHSKSVCSCNYKKGGKEDENILFMLLQLSHFCMKMSNSPFAKQCVFSVLFDYVCYVETPHVRASLTLAAILKNDLSFKTLIVNGFVSELDEKMNALHDLRCCNRCSNIVNVHHEVIDNCRSIVEKDFARKTLCNLLTSNQSVSKLQAMYAISRLVVDKNALSEILYTKDAMQIIFDSLCSENKAEKEESLRSICEMYKNISSERKKRLTKLYPKKSQFPVFCQAKKKTTCSFEGYEYDVEFLLGCGTKVLACRKKMSEQSDYFRALLNGYFSEGNSKLIKLPHITKNALSVILHFLHGCGKKGYCPVFDKISLNLSRELLKKCDEFLLFRMKTIIENHLISFLSQKTVANIYDVGKKYNSSTLCDKIIDYVLTRDTSNMKAFRKLFNELMCDDFLMDLKSFFKDHFEIPLDELQSNSEKILMKYI